MTRPLSFGTAVAALLALAVEALGLSRGHSAAMVMTALLCIVSLLVIAHADLATVGAAAAYASAFTLPWNGWLIAGVRVGDLLLLVALACFLAGNASGELPHLPGWVVQLGLVIVLIWVAHVLIPTDAHFLANRTLINAGGRPRVEADQAVSFVAFKFVVATTALPMVYAFAAQRDPRAVRRLIISFVTGVSISGLVAFVEGRGVVSISHLLTHHVWILNREGGFADHPNFLAAGCVLALPFSVWLIASSHRNRWLGVALIPGIVLGVYASGSRGGAASLPLELFACFLVLPRIRPHLPTFLLLGGVTTTAIIVLFPGFGQTLLEATRLNGAGSGSDQVRTILANQALHDFVHSPIDGIGLQVIFDAQSVYLQVLASGGLVLMAAIIVYTASSMVAAGRLMQRHTLGGALLVSLVAMVAFNLVGADLSDRFFYIPIAIVVAFSLAEKSHPDRLADELEPSAREFAAAPPSDSKAAAA